VISFSSNKQDSCKPIRNNLAYEENVHMVLLVNWTEAEEANCSSFSEIASSLSFAHLILFSYIEHDDLDCFLYHIEDPAEGLHPKLSLVYSIDWPDLYQASNARITPRLLLHSKRFIYFSFSSYPSMNI